MRTPLIFLNRHAATKARLGHRKFAPGYVTACKWFHCGLVDRTKTLDIGVPYHAFDPIPNLQKVRTFGEIADATGEDILRESLDRRRHIQVLWSGGIDSTVALIGLSRAASTSRLRERIQVVCSKHSIEEYQRFFLEHVLDKFNCLITPYPIGDALDDSRLIVTGEHGDQLFGSVKLQRLVEKGEALRPYRSLQFLRDEVGDAKAAAELKSFLRPQIEASPVKIRTVFDYYWWVNFSLKWQHVSLRLAVFRGKRFWRTYFALRHFFRGPAFQVWALTNPKLRSLNKWSEYKRPAKAYILTETGDRDYFRSKTKEPSLQNVLVNRSERGGFRVRVSWRLGETPDFDYFKPKARADRDSAETEVDL